VNKTENNFENNSSDTFIMIALSLSFLFLLSAVIIKVPFHDVFSSAILSVVLRSLKKMNYICKPIIT